MYTRIAALYFITYVIALPLLCSVLPYNAYSIYLRHGDKTDRKDLEKAADENQRRLAVAEEYLGKTGPHSRVFKRLRHTWKKRIQPQIVITVVTVARQPMNGLPEPKYLTQVVTQFAQLLEKEETDIVFQVCNVHFPPEAHYEAVYLSRYVPVVHRGSTEQEQVVDRFEKEKLDYIYCLEKSLDLSPQYVLMVEDDALPTPDMLHVLRHKLQYRLNMRVFQGELLHNGDDWAFLKLYSMERWQGYGNDITSALELTGAGLLGGTVFLYALQRRRQKMSRRFVNFVLGFVYVVLLCWTIGRQNLLLQFRRLSAQLYTVKSAPYCCTQAVLYPTDMAAEIARFLKTRTCKKTYAVDFVLSDFAINKGIQRYLVEPNLFQHVGFVSSLRSDVKDPQSGVALG